MQIVENLDLYNFVRSNNSRYVDMYLPLAYTFAISYRNTFYINLLTLTFKNMILLFVNVKRCFFFNVSEFRPDIKKKSENLKFGNVGIFHVARNESIATAFFLAGPKIRTS